MMYDLGYLCPDITENGEPTIAHLARVCDRAYAEHYSGRNGHRRKARARLDEELKLIDELGLAGFFLLHWEVLELARELAVEVRGRDSPRSSLPPGRGRGSSVGSIVCYLTGLSHVDPVQAELSLGRFLNRDLASVPDIDLDFPRDIREKLIVGVTERYGHEHAALVASFATYRARGAIRDVGKALGLPFAELERLARVSDGWNAARIGDELLMLPDAQAKLATPRWRAFAELWGEDGGLPRPPANLDDITIQVALVRPGPIQGKAVHPYIERRQKLREDPRYVPPADHPLLQEPLRETLGVVVFQDQVLDVAIALAGFTVGEAEGLRRAMSRKRSHEALEAMRTRFVAGALANGVDEELANRVYDK